MIRLTRFGDIIDIWINPRFVQAVGAHVCQKGYSTVYVYGFEFHVKGEPDEVSRLLQDWSR